LAVFSTNGFKIEHVVIAIDQLYRTIQMLGVPKVLVGRLFHRKRVLRKRGLTLAQYNARVDKNRTLEANSLFHGYIEANSLFHGYIEANSLFHGYIEANSLFHGYIEANSLFHGYIEANSLFHGHIEANSLFHGHIFWKHRRLQFPNVEIMSDDGVHQMLR
jgi:hypothetical protein